MEKDLKMNIDLIENGQLHVKLFLNEEDIVPLLINSHGQSSQEPNKKSSTIDGGMMINIKLFFSKNLFIAYNNFV